MEAVGIKEIESLEDTLGVSPDDVAKECSKKKSNIYATYRAKNKNFYKIMLIGVRVLRSNLTMKQFREVLEQAESLKGSN